MASDPFLGGEIGVEILRKALKIEKILTVLDIGCGNGLFVQWIKETFSPLVKFLGIDIDWTALKKGLAHLKDEAFVCADGTILPLKEESVDLTFCRRLLMNVPNPRAIIAEMFRVTKKNGRIVVIEPDFLAQSGHSSVDGELALQRDLLVATAGEVDLGFGPKSLALLNDFPLTDLQVWCYVVLEMERNKPLVASWKESVARFQKQLGDAFQSTLQRAKLIDNAIQTQIKEERYCCLTTFPMYVYSGQKE